MNSLLGIFTLQLSCQTKAVTSSKLIAKKTFSEQNTKRIVETPTSFIYITSISLSAGIGITSARFTEMNHA